MLWSLRSLEALSLAVASSFAIAACAGKVPPPAAIDALVVSKEEPPADAVKIADIQAKDGSGCGITGTGGSYEGALRKLRLRAKSLGADFVQLTSVKEPYHDHQCAHRAFEVAGVAYRVSPPEAAAPPETAAPCAPAPAPALAVPTAGEGPAFRVGASGFALRAPNAPTAASLTFAARLTAPAFAIWIDEAATEPGRSGFALRYDRAARRLEVVSYPAATAVSVAAEPVEVDQSIHVWRLARSAEQIEVFLDGKPLLVTLARAQAPESSFRLEPDQFEIRRISP